MNILCEEKVLVRLNAEVPLMTRMRLKIYCIQQGMEMKQFVTDLLNETLDKLGAEEVKPIHLEKYYSQKRGK
ncbi:hypothetical protein [Priestia megaterium]|uniref:hypothetical protein n=1 Tax=Priestia megaterium TaxID=1404 RepID=UPI000BFE8DAF|nr:hypothetical protein [Priestia megaterium]PGQ88347.1 hypothetical protein COA18_05300 [Priestia megaterium]